MPLPLLAVGSVLARLPARGRSRGTVIPFAGGPGGALSADLTEVAALHATLPREDLLLVDARGTGRSTFLRCRALDGELLAGEAAVRANGRCGRQLGPQRDVFTTAATVADVASLRRTLCLGPAGLVGFSYGTAVATTYLRFYPRAVRVAVLDGAYPLDDRFLRDIAIATPWVARLVCTRTRACDPDAAVAALEQVAVVLRTGPVALPGSRRVLTESLFATVGGLSNDHPSTCLTGPCRASPPSCGCRTARCPRSPRSSSQATSICRRRSRARAAPPRASRAACSSRSPARRT